MSRKEEKQIVILHRRNTYKRRDIEEEMNKRGQLAIYIILAVVIIAAIGLVYFFYPEIKSAVSGEVVPSNYLRSCIEDDVKSSIETLSKQGGYRDPQGFIWYKDNKVKYLCYTADYYVPCKVQQPMIRQQFENDLNAMLTERVNDCMQELKSEYEGRGYNVVMEKPHSKVEILPHIIKITFETPMTIAKDTTQRFDSFEADVPSEMYNLLMISTSVLDYEVTYGDAETTMYMPYYPNMKMEKYKQEDGSTVYIVSDVVSNESFMFASRSVAWPAGYGISS